MNRKLLKVKNGGLFPHFFLCGQMNGKDVCTNWGMNVRINCGMNVRTKWDKRCDHKMVQMGKLKGTYS